MRGLSVFMIFFFLCTTANAMESLCDFFYSVFCCRSRCCRKTEQVIPEEVASPKYKVRVEVVVTGHGPHRSESNIPINETYYTDALRKAAEEGNVQKMQKILNADLIDVNSPGEGGRTALHAAVVERQYEAAAALLCYKADVNMPDLDGQTPLRLAERRDILDLLQDSEAAAKQAQAYLKK